MGPWGPHGPSPALLPEMHGEDLPGTPDSELKGLVLLCPGGLDFLAGHMAPCPPLRLQSGTKQAHRGTTATPQKCVLSRPRSTGRLLSTSRPTLPRGSQRSRRNDITPIMCGSTCVPGAHRGLLPVLADSGLTALRSPGAEGVGECRVPSSAPALAGSFPPLSNNQRPGWRARG